MTSARAETGFLPRNPVSNRLIPLLILLFLILLGFALRVHNLDAFSFWTDEGLTPERSGYAVAQILRNDIVIQGVVTTDTHPPLYYLIIHLTRRLFGLSDFAFRYPSVLFGVLLIPLLYQLGRRMGGRTVGLIAGLLAAVNPLQVYYSQEARMYSLLVLLVTGMSYVLWRAMQLAARRREGGEGRRGERGKGRRGEREKGSTPSPLHPLTLSLLLYLLLAALAVYTHYTAVFIVAAQALLWAWVLWRAMRATSDELRDTSEEARSPFVSRISYFVFACLLVVAVVVAVPLLPYTLPRLTTGAEANYYVVSPLTMLLDVVRFFNLGLTVDFDQRLVVALNVLAFGLALLGLWRMTNDERRTTNEERASRMTNDERRTTNEFASHLRSPRSLSPYHPFSPSPLPSCSPAALGPWLPRFFLLGWLLAVVFGLMAGSILFKPMYQGVRHIMAGSPAWLLLIAFGVWAIWNWLPERRDKPVTGDEDESTGWTAWRSQRPNMNPLALIPLGLLLIGAAVALVNLYTNPAYVKDDFRAIVRFIETRAGNRDVIVYNNAVLLPLHEHYRRRDDLAVTALPAYPQFATGAEPELASLARDYDRAWFVTDPPADRRDEDKLIQAWLDANLTETINRLFPARTTEARVIAYRTTADRRPTTDDGSSLTPSPLLPVSLSPLLSLTGVAFDSPLELPTLWVDLAWRGERPAANASLLFTLTGPDGVEYFREARPILPDEDTRWDETTDNPLSYDLPLPPGLPPGDYTLVLTAEGSPPLALGPVEIAPTTSWPAAPEVLFEEAPGRPNTKYEIRNTNEERVSGLVSRISYLVSHFGDSAVDWPNGLSLAAVVPWDDAVLPGNNLPLTLYWRTGPDGADLSDLRYRLEVVGDDGTVLRTQESKPGAPWLGRLPGGALLRQDTGLYFRPDTEPGRYGLRWTLLDGDTPLGEPTTSGRIVVEPWPLETEAPPAPYVIGAEFGPDIRLHSYYAGVPTGGLLNLALYWQAVAEPQTDYTVFIHLVDENGNIVSQVDSVPVGGARPTTGWRAGEVITDIHNLPIPADLPPGAYHVNAGLYDPDDGTRPTVVVGGEPQPDNQLRLEPTFDLPWEQP